ncbi:Internal alternative NAD(P)H-ubiquinone oxidoreductase A2 [Citrus sinensis]|uniref:Internal alternative NAD(P)H-ubiquinone oxidoreductase A2 n=1 Tax=Citrus sinensis TaxID=2711 RepID=A0ACB8IXW5_CITSI|nr:Internal alternative NAD(P)H-ubiquinone oxidoreductase A2 [Citrus sinensis]
MSLFKHLLRNPTAKSYSYSSPSIIMPSNLILTCLSHFTTDASPSTVQLTQYSGLGPTKANEKPRVVVLGSGWAGCRLMKGIDTSLYDVVCVSPRNHMVFTPLLASTCVGTLEFRSVAEPIARIQPAISREPGSYFFLSHCAGIDTDNHVGFDGSSLVIGVICGSVMILDRNAGSVHCETVTDELRTLEPWKFKISYDKLVIALGAEASTFGIHGVKENAIFLREVHHAQEIRRKLLLNLMMSDVPGISEEEKSRLLHCVVVGGGPTGVEFSGELSDFIMRDVRQRYSHVKDYIHVTLIEALCYKAVVKGEKNFINAKVLSFSQSGVRLVRGIVKDVDSQKLILNDGTEVPYGLLVWSTGVGPSTLVKSLDLPKSPGGRIGIDEWLRVPSVQDVFAVGDCSGYLESTGKTVLPALAQVAERQGKYLFSLLNRIGKAGGGRANSAKDMELGDPFVYRHLGSMATIGRYKALVDLRQNKPLDCVTSLWCGYLKETKRVENGSELANGLRGRFVRLN